MLGSTADNKQITLLEDLPNVTPVERHYFENWNIRAAEDSACHNYLSPNRRDFYKAMFVTGGSGVFSLGMHSYYVEESTVVFMHPNEIISWRNLSDGWTKHYCLFKKRYVDLHPTLKSAMDKYRLFSDPQRSVIRLQPTAAAVVDTLFRQLQTESTKSGTLAEDAMQAYLQLIMIESMKEANFPEPEVVSDDYRHVHDFFHLLENETANINYDKPLRIRTAKEFAELLQLHPNHLNALLKKHTGQTISTHIKSRLLDESKALLLQTDWTLQDIGYCIGFADQPNFSQFFKKNLGITPNEFRRTFVNVAL
ncbi:helix-turn-helix transcriptional regulator [Spirosoma daeguense]